ncbi:helix-turn-helix domain-containing protein [Mycolicibacter sp. MYC123]|uniref:Helix-turn-helix domain-containing protein n=1 Tax=[Mycobacterium] zoologicum TaxID=2872311 RepID=A0ABU5YJ44_9MYCO|nr:helix-turn-helix domain-containing protein [Mycolicibacter sp. MYC123]MEB3049825.1 helix-turn-helix domain-containing protein [Mycolicibacter sp. MYC123]
MAEKGWEATTAAEIGRRAGYSRAMVHARYGSKDAILDAFFEHDYVRRLSPDVDPDSTGLARAGSRALR